jgi:Bacterial regulatory proteins, tetR family
LRQTVRRPGGPAECGLPPSRAGVFLTPVRAQPISPALRRPRPENKRRGRRVRGRRERRSEILRAARKVFEERGFLDTRVADIVAAAGVAQGTFYSYFDSKEAVFAEVAQQVVETMMEGLRTDFVRISTRWSGSGGPRSGSSRPSGRTRS